jgi:predicted GNAT family acetyltransferase
MRWSLILSTSLVLSTLSVALVIPSEFVELERRAGGAKASSKTYRKNSENHGYAYKFDKAGGVTREKLKAADRQAHGKKMLMIPKTDADHVFEHQMLNNHLAKHNLQYDKLHPKLQHEVKGIINGPQNVAPVPAGVNRGKGSVIKKGLEGKAIKPNKSRDQYTLLSYKTARKTAQKLDKAFENHGHDFKGNTFHKTLRNTMNSAKIMHPNDPSPKSSDHGSVKGSPRKPIAVPVKKPKVSLPIRRSARIAANRRNSQGSK